MKANRKRLEIAMANACMNASDLVEAANIPRPSFNNVLTGRSVRPATIGQIARALGVDVREILED